MSPLGAPLQIAPHPCFMDKGLTNFVCGTTHIRHATQRRGFVLGLTSAALIAPVSASLSTKSGTVQYHMCSTELCFARFTMLRHQSNHWCQRIRISGYGYVSKWRIYIRGVQLFRSISAKSIHPLQSVSGTGDRLSTLYPKRLLQTLRTPASTMPGCKYSDPKEGGFECGQTCQQGSEYCEKRKRMNSEAMDFIDKPSIRRMQGARLP